MVSSEVGTDYSDSPTNINVREAPRKRRFYLGQNAQLRVGEVGWPQSSQIFGVGGWFHNFGPFVPNKTVLFFLGGGGLPLQKGVGEYD